MKFFTSRYTAALEEQIKELKAEIVERKQTILGLYADLAELRLQVAGRLALQEIKPDKDKPEPPRSVNWLRTRPLLETPNLDVREAPPEKERTANGTR